MKHDYAALLALFGPIITERKLGRYEVRRLIPELSEKGARRLLEMLRGERPVPPAPRALTVSCAPAPDQQVQDTEQDGERTVTAKGGRIKTIEDLIAAANVDLTLWEVTWAEVNKYEMGRKAQRSRLDYTDGKANGKVRDSGGVHVEELYQVKVKLKPRRDVVDLLALKESALAEVRAAAATLPRAPRPQVARPRTGNLLYLGMHDLHPGKMVAPEETGHVWNPELAREVALKALTRALEKASAHGFDRIVLPIGHDLSHVDGNNNATTGGTAQDVSRRYHVQRRLDLALAGALIERAAEFAPVEAEAVPGNHGRSTDLAIAEMLRERYHADPRVQVRVSLAPRVYLSHGVNLLGFTHGDRIKAQALMSLMAREAKQEWAASEHQEWLIGHTHAMSALTEKYLVEQTGQEHVGVRVRVLPSLTATDYWHAACGYVASGRALEAYLYHEAHGYEGHVNVPLREVL